MHLSAPPQRIVGGRANAQRRAVPVPQHALVALLTKATQQGPIFCSCSILRPKTRRASPRIRQRKTSLPSAPDLVLLKGFTCATGVTLEQPGHSRDLPGTWKPEQYQRDLQTLGQALGALNALPNCGPITREILDRVAQGTQGLTEAQKPRC